MSSWLGRSCGEGHDGPPLSYGAAAPAHWDPADTDESSVLDGELCVIAGRHFFVRAPLAIPVSDAAPGTEFNWGVWVSLSEANLRRAVSVWDDPARHREPPYFGWLSTVLPTYEPTMLNLATDVHTQPVGARPLVELEPTDHPLAV